MTDLEVWANGTRHELGALHQALAGIGRIAETGDTHPLGGADTGRHRLFLRIAVPLSAAAGQPAPHRTAPDRVALPLTPGTLTALTTTPRGGAA